MTIPSKSIQAGIAIFWALLLLQVLPADAGPLRDNQKQACRKSDIDLAAKVLGSETKPIEKREDRDELDLDVIASACKLHPVEKNVLIIAMVSRSDVDDQPDLNLATINIASGTLIAKHHARLQEDSSLRIERNSLRIDTANYQFNPTTRAIGLDIKSGYVANCGDGGSGAERSIFVSEGRVLRPVVQNFMLSNWNFIAQSLSRCNSDPTSPQESIIANYSFSISLANHSTNGFRDIVVTTHGERDDGKPTPLPSGFQYTVKYDGTTFPEKQFIDGNEAWLRQRK